MIRSLNTAERAMTLEQVRIDALANNLANANATGFRQVLTRVAEPEQTKPQTAARAQPSEAPGGSGVSGTEAGNWAPISRADMFHALDNRPGPVSATGRSTDVAIMGEGFFEVSTPDGPRYTRNGSFVLDAQQRLTTPDGFAVVGESGALSLAGESFDIGNDGTVTVDGQVNGRLKLVSFPDPSRLEHVGGSLLMAPIDLPPTPLTAEETVVAQGHVEGSNVNPVDTLVAMIQAQRAFEIQAKVLTTEDEMLNKSVNNLPRAGS